VAIELPTGSGKSIISLLILEMWRRIGKRVAILTSSIALGDDMKRRCEDLGISNVVIVGAERAERGGEEESRERIRNIREYKRGNAIGIERRRTFKAYDGINNTLNLAYAVLKWKVHRATMSAKLEPYLGFLHSEQFGKPSLVCDLMEAYRYLIDDFVIQYCMNLKKKDFAMKREGYSSNREGEREYLSKTLTKDMMNRLNSFFETIVEVWREKHGNKQTVETLINEEAFLFAQYLRDEKPTWQPRIVALS
jgi:hypothetical protein